MSVHTDEERSLLRKAIDFDESALAEIYDRYQSALYRYAYRLLGDQQLAEDCIADTFFRFLKNLRKGNAPTENLRAYLYRIAHNWVTDYYRRAQKAPEQELTDHLAKNEDMDEVVSNRLESEVIRSTILTLTPDQQQVIILKYLEGWQNEEIARFMGKRVGAVKALLHRSLVTLKKKCVLQEKE
mgnify:FL=1